jgi:hypothetical protein
MKNLKEGDGIMCRKAFLLKALMVLVSISQINLLLAGTPWYYLGYTPECNLYNPVGSTVAIKVPDTSVWTESRKLGKVLIGDVNKDKVMDFVYQVGNKVIVKSGMNLGGGDIASFDVSGELQCLADVDNNGSLDLITVEKQKNKVFFIRLYDIATGNLVNTIELYRDNYRHDVGLSIDQVADLDGDGSNEILAHFSAGYGLIPRSVVALSTGVVAGEKTSGGLRGEYFDDREFTQLKLTRIDSTINFDWGVNAPDQSMAPDTFSIRWSGWLKVTQSGEYEFYTVTDDGVRVWVDVI